VARYGLAERAVGFFRFFAEPAPGFAEQARSVVAAGLAAGEDPQEAVRAALAQHGTGSRAMDVPSASTIWPRRITYRGQPWTFQPS
jgi:hypothetical protein